MLPPMLLPGAADHPAADILAGLDVPRVPQQARSRQKRDAILAAAAHLFEERGYEATTADDIAAAAGVSIGTFYSYFRNKRQVFITLAAGCIESILSLGIADLEIGTDVRQTIRATVEQAMQRDPLFYGMRRAWAELRPRDPEVAAFDQQINQMVYSQIVTAARRAAAQGRIWPDLDIEATCWAITLLLDRAWQTEPKPGEASPEQISRQRHAIADLIYHALFKAL
ncbi:MAG TPA: TetR/AcrR family transcriptional regulator [Chloroflexia bacterium]|nr:TetR/AcrR family transcriptional regulator [Chloroflexia bacterium]